MSQADETSDKSVIRLGASFVTWGLGLVVFGLFLEFGIIGHYVIGANHPTGEQFLHNVTLWFGCPWTLAVYTIQLGGLAMAVFGAVYLVLAKTFPGATAGSSGRIALWLCVIALLGIFATGYVGYFVVDAIWHEFYYRPVEAGKNVWLAAQAACLLCYFVGASLVFQSVRKLIHTGI
jgi:hypothetical protein